MSNCIKYKLVSSQTLHYPQSAQLCAFHSFWTFEMVSHFNWIYVCVCVCWICIFLLWMRMVLKSASCSSVLCVLPITLIRTKNGPLMNAHFIFIFILRYIQPQSQLIYDNSFGTHPTNLRLSIYWLERIQRFDIIVNQLFLSYTQSKALEA